MNYRKRVQENEWAWADYALEWDGAVLRFWAEGYDNPKDAWGFDRSYPPAAMDELALAEIERVFGPEIRAEVAQATSPSRRSSSAS